MYVVKNSTAAWALIVAAGRPTALMLSQADRHSKNKWVAGAIAAYDQDDNQGTIMDGL
jgi:hypothetical protein